VPRTFISSRLIGGFGELQQLDSSGELAVALEGKSAAEET
jgi:hypothetical protein